MQRKKDKNLVTHEYEVGRLVGVRAPKQDRRKTLIKNHAGIIREKLKNNMFRVQ